jgi:hypothetical protein
MFVYETYGRKKYLEIFGTSEIDKRNGYFYGKSWLDLTIKMWKEDIQKGILHISSLSEYDELILKKIY